MAIESHITLHRRAEPFFPLMVLVYLLLIYSLRALVCGDLLTCGLIFSATQKQMGCRILCLFSRDSQMLKVDVSTILSIILLPGISLRILLNSQTSLL